MGNGGRYERKFIQALEAAGYSTMRAGGSGGATEFARPDVIAGRSRGGEVWACELKTTSRTTAYADAEEVEALEGWASDFGATPVIVARFKGDRTYWFVRPEDTRKTDAGTYGVPEADVRERMIHAVDEVDP